MFGFCEKSFHEVEFFAADARSLDANLNMATFSDRYSFRKGRSYQKCSCFSGFHTERFVLARTGFGSRQDCSYKENATKFLCRQQKNMGLWSVQMVSARNWSTSALTARCENHVSSGRHTENKLTNSTSRDSSDKPTGQNEKDVRPPGTKTEWELERSASVKK